MPPRICLPQPGTSPNAIHAPLPTWSPRYSTFLRDWTRASSKDPSNACRGGMLVRSWPLPPYRIYYRRRDGYLEVMRVYHQARQPITR